MGLLDCKSEIKWVSEEARQRFEAYKKAKAEPKTAPQGGSSCCGQSKEASDLERLQPPWVPPPRTKPTQAQMIKLFVLSMKDWKKAGYKLVDKVEHKRRYAICKGCEFLVDYRCEKCNCFMFAKTKLAGMRCRESRW